MKNKDVTMYEESSSCTNDSKNREKISGKAVVIGGSLGILLGAAATYADSKLKESAVYSEDELIDVCNYNDMSFGEAWRLARTQLGPNGVFEWKGNVYSTATKEEWEYSHNQSEILETEYNGNVQNEEPNAHTTHNMESNNDFGSADIQIIGVEEGKIGNNPITIGGAIIQGHEAVVIDIDHDGTFDDAIIDKNDNHNIDEGENVNIQNKNITVGDYQSYSNHNIDQTNSDNNDIEIIGVEDANINGHNVTVGTAVIGGHGSLLVDSDKDGFFDIGAIDFNDNNNIEDNEIYDIREKNISVSSFRNSAVNNETSSFTAEDNEDIDNNEVPGADDIESDVNSLSDNNMYEM